MPLTPEQIDKIDELIEEYAKNAKNAMRSAIKTEVVDKMGADAGEVEEYLRTLFKFLQDDFLHEQALYWQRFTALAALNAGFFVLATSKAVANPQLLEWCGFGLGFLWLLIQGQSLHYADRAKPQYHTLRDNIFGITYAKGWLPKWRWLSATWVAFYTTIVVLLLWFLLAMGCVG